MEETKPLGFENLHIEDNKKEDKEEGLSTCVQCKKVLPEANMELHPEFEKIKVFDIFFYFVFTKFVKFLSEMVNGG